MDGSADGRDAWPAGATIRVATRDDAAALAHLLAPLGYPTTAEAVAAVWDGWTAEGNLALVAERNRSVLGMITLHRMIVLHRPRPVGRITSLSVDPAARGQGLGRALVRAAEDALVGAGCGIVEVTSNVRRTEAHAFYRHLDYEQTSVRFARDFTPPTW